MIPDNTAEEDRSKVMNPRRTATTAVLARIAVLLLTSLAMVAGAPSASAETTVFRYSGSGIAASGFSQSVDECRYSQEYFYLYQDDQDRSTWGLTYYRWYSDACTGEYVTGSGSAEADVTVRGALATLHVIATVPLDDGSIANVDATFTRTSALTFANGVHSTQLLPGGYVVTNSFTGRWADGVWTGSFVGTGQIQSSRLNSTVITVAL